MKKHDRSERADAISDLCNTVIEKYMKAVEAVDEKNGTTMGFTMMASIMVALASQMKLLIEELEDIKEEIKNAQG